MRNVKIKAAGHFVERNIFQQLESVIEGTPCDITDIELYLPTLKGGIDMKCPSIVSFNLIARRVHVDVYYEKVMDVLLNNDCNIIFTSIEE